MEFALCCSPELFRDGNMGPIFSASCTHCRQFEIWVEGHRLGEHLLHGLLRAPPPD